MLHPGHFYCLGLSEFEHLFLIMHCRFPQPPMMLRQKTFTFNISARVDPDWWDPDQLAEAFFSSKKLQQSLSKPVSMAKQFWSVQLPEVPLPASLGTKTESPLSSFRRSCSTLAASTFKDQSQKTKTKHSRSLMQSSSWTASPRRMLASTNAWLAKARRQSL
jgi:hypothetical protein